MAIRAISGKNAPQWMVALATTHDGDVPLFLQPLDGTSLDTVSLLAAVMAIQKQLREADAEPSVYVADNGISSEPNMRQLNGAGITWISRVSETSTEAKTVLQEGSQDWQQSEDGSIQWYRRVMDLPQGSARLSSSCAPRLRRNGRSAVLRLVGSGSAGIWARSALPVKLMHGQPWSGNCKVSRHGCKSTVMSWLMLAMQARGVRAKRRVLRPTSGRSWQPSLSTSLEWTRKRCGIRLFHCRD
jgi:hypothetical protein